MREELKEAVSALRERTGARPVLLPPPYARGHFTVRCAAAPQNDALFTFRMGEGCAFASMTDGYLAALLRKMDASVPRFLPDPARSPEDTLLVCGSLYVASDLRHTARRFFEGRGIPHSPHL